MIAQLSDPLIPSSLLGPVLLDQLGLPRYWATIWSIATAGHLAESTHLKKLRYLNNLYQHADELKGHGALDLALGTLDDHALAEILESWFISIRNQPETTDADETRWQAGLSFVITVVTWITKGNSDQRLRPIEIRLQQLSILYRQLKINKRNSAEPIRSLPASTIETLYKILDPESEQNPFPRIGTRWRIYVSFILMLHQGLRRGEILLLPADAVKSAYDIKLKRVRYWINIQENGYEDAINDPRHSKPGIKTKASIRQIPVGETTARIIETYLQNYRAKPNHSYLLNSQNNKPLSTEALTKAFAQISEHIPKTVIKDLEARTAKTSITPHDLRHTCAVVRLQQLLEQGDSMDEAIQKIRTFFGWSRESTMPSRYARAVFEDRLSSVWNNAFDDRITLLRALPKGH
ncbi:MAG: site-specific integrase [Herminiimonas sp.]|uniref:site-specific integrase n=1 Tax=Herminiimonas sp. TaxID=1926289 RepID=UPI00271FA18E|nr:site-specific integrase [Herminiimonas sp.]MDO9421064.1 site-specific integrase [Herminiimonas sp.]